MEETSTKKSFTWMVSIKDGIWELLEIITSQSHIIWEEGGTDWELCSIRHGMGILDTKQSLLMIVLGSTMKLMLFGLLLVAMEAELVSKTLFIQIDFWHFSLVVKLFMEIGV